MQSKACDSIVIFLAVTVEVTHGRETSQHPENVVAKWTESLNRKHCAREMHLGREKKKQIDDKHSQYWHGMTQGPRAKERTKESVLNWGSGKVIWNSCFLARYVRALEKD